VTSLTGTFTALVTPFRDDRIDFAALERLLETQLAAGVDGLVPCGTTGEAPTLSPDEQRELISFVIRHVRKRIPVIAGTGSNATDKTVAASRQAAAAGADALLVVAPYYNRPTQAGLYAHFSAVARSVELPLVLYNIPGRCGVEIQVDTFRRLRTDHANIIAVKDATGRLDSAAQLLQSTDVGVLSGDDPLTLPLMALGAHGVISVLSNLAPRAVKQLTTAMLAGDLPAARAAHRRIDPLARALLSLETNPIPIKTALSLRGVCAAEFRLPLCSMAADTRTRLAQLMEQHPLD